MTLLALENQQFMFEQYKAQEGSDPLFSTIGGIIRLGWVQLVPSGLLFEYFKLLLALKIKEESAWNP